jgi:hypothetical protein
MELVKIIHPSDGSVAEVPSESLIHHYRAGWRPLSDEEDAARTEAAVRAAAGVPEPKPMTKAQAAKAAKAGSEE